MEITIQIENPTKMTGDMRYAVIDPNEPIGGVRIRGLFPTYIGADIFKQATDDRNYKIVELT